MPQSSDGAAARWLYEALARRTLYDLLPDRVRLELLKTVGVHYGMTFLRPVSFCRWEMGLDTALFDFQGSEFVFIPGDEVTLGWDGFPPGGGPELEELKAALERDAADIGRKSAEDDLRIITTPIRQAVILPMLVERSPRPCEGTPEYEYVDLTEPRVASYFARNPESRVKLEAFLHAEKPRFINFKEFSGRGTYLHIQKEKNGPSVRLLYMCDNFRYDGIVAAQGFRLPSMDEWEYLCGGGRRSLFAWGDRLAFAADKPVSHSASKPGNYNFFGLRISDDPWRLEVVSGSGYWFKGGDGGGADCVGPMEVYSDMPCSPYYTGGPLVHMEDRDPISDDDYYRRVLTVHPAALTSYLNT